MIGAMWQQVLFLSSGEKVLCLELNKWYIFRGQAGSGGRLNTDKKSIFVYNVGTYDAKASFAVTKRT